MSIPAYLLEDLPPRWRRKPHAHQTELSKLRFSADELLREVAAGCASCGGVKVVWSFALVETLAFIETEPQQSTVRITMHSILNSAQTPLEVIRGIFKHEVLHLEVRPREIDGKLVAHPPEFWERERELIPEMPQVWSWLMFNFMFAIKCDRENERTIIKCKQAREILRDDVRLSWDDAAETAPEVDQDEFAAVRQGLM